MASHGEGKHGQISRTKMAGQRGVHIVVGDDALHFGSSLGRCKQLAALPASLGVLLCGGGETDRADRAFRNRR